MPNFIDFHYAIEVRITYTTEIVPTEKEVTVTPETEKTVTPTSATEKVVP